MINLFQAIYSAAVVPKCLPYPHLRRDGINAFYFFRLDRGIFPDVSAPLTPLRLCLF